MEAHLIHLINILIDRGSLIERLVSVIFRTGGDSLNTIIDISLIFITVNFSLWLVFSYYTNYILANNEIFRGFDNAHTVLLNQNIRGPMNLNIHLTRWNPFNPLYQRAVDVNNPLNPFHYANPRSPFNFNNRLYALVTNPFNPVGRTLINPLDSRYLYIMNR